MVATTILIYNLHAVINPATFDDVPLKIWSFATSPSLALPTSRA